MKTELIVSVTPAVVAGNFDDLKKALEIEVKKYDIQVTKDTVKDAKKLATELNAVAKVINEVKKKELETLEAPVKDFKDKIKELIDVVQVGRVGILDQVAVFETETKALIAGLLKDFVIDVRDHLEIDDQYSIRYDDLIILGSLTTSENLTAKAKEAITSRANECLQLQNTVKMRLLELENESYKAGLKAPLSVEYIKNFLYESDDIYKARLAELIDIELKRQVDSLERSEKEAERLIQQANQQRKEAEEREEKAKQDLIDEQNKPKEAPQTQSKPKAIDNAPEGKKTLRMAVSFDVIVRGGADNDRASGKIGQMLKDAGLTSLLGSIGVQNFTITAEG